MAYIGKSPSGTGVRSRFYYTQTSGGGTSISGTDDNSKTLTFTDGEYIDVFLNGVLLVAGTDYNTNTANTISGLAALANGDVVEVVVYDIFTVADTVSASQGGTFNAGVTMSDGLTVDDDGATVLTVDRASSHGDIVEVQKDGTRFGALGSQSSGFYIDGESGHSGLRFANGAVTPREDLADADNSNDLGASNNRWANLYLGGNLYIGGTGSANALYDYEEGTWTATMIGTTSNPSTSITSTGYYTKVGRLVYLACRIINKDTTGAAGGIRITGNPFSIADGSVATGNVMLHKRYNASASTTVNIAPYVTTSYIGFYRSNHNDVWAEITHNPGNDHYLIFTAVFHV